MKNDSLGKYSNLTKEQLEALIKDKALSFEDKQEAASELSRRIEAELLSSINIRQSITGDFLRTAKDNTKYKKSETKKISPQPKARLPEIKTNHQKNTNSNLSGDPSSVEKNNVASCAIFLGCLGIHKFLLGYNVEGLIMLLITVLTFGYAAILVAIVGLMEGIIYLSMTEEKFRQTYILNKKGWF